MSYKYYLQSIRLPSGSIISQLTDTTPAPNVNYLVDYAAGQVSPSFRGAHGAKPDISFTTPQIKTVLDACGFVDGDQSAGNVDLYYQAAEERGTREAINSSLHLRLRVANALLYWTRLNAQQDQAATIACRLVPTYNGSTPPIVPAGTVTIPSVVMATENYTLGPVYLNAVEVARVSAWELQLNPTLDEVAWSGSDWIRSVVVERHNPELTVTTQDLAYWASIGMTGVELTALAAYLRKRQENSTACYAAGSAVHIGIAGVDNPCGMATIENSTEGAQKAAALKIRCGLSIAVAGTSYPLTGSYLTTIP